MACSCHSARARDGVGGQGETLAKAFETAVTTAEISLLQDSSHPDDQTSRSAIIPLTEGDSLREKLLGQNFAE